MISDRDYWHGHVEYTGCEALLKECKDYDLILTGDNHHTFNYKNRILNSGSTMRASIDQVDHKPCFFIYHDKKNVEQIEFDIEDAAKVLRLDDTNKEKEVNSKLINFVDELSLDHEMEELKFIDNVKAAIDSVDSDVKDIILEVIKDVE
jgi:acetolactate synthase small subunit